MISAISSQGKVRFMLYQDTMNQQRLIRFMERLVRSSGQKVFLILDNLKVHHGKLAAVWLEKNKEKIEVFFLPPYAPEYNPDEYLNHALKISVHSGQLPYTTKDISHKIQSFMRKLQHHPSLVSSFFRHPALVRILLRGADGKGNITVQFQHGQFCHLAHSGTALFYTNEKICIGLFH